MASNEAMTIARHHVSEKDEPNTVKLLANDIDAAIQAAVQNEREACELVVLRRRDEAPYRSSLWYILDALAGRINDRNRKEQPDEAQA